MKFMMFVVSDAQPDQPSDESDIDLWVDPLDASGKRIIGEILAPGAESTVVKVRGGKVLTTAGPFAETSEVILGFDILDVADLDEAISLSPRAPRGLEPGSSRCALSRRGMSPPDGPARPPDAGIRGSRRAGGRAHARPGIDC